MSQEKEKKYVKVPWKSFIPSFVLLLMVLVPCFINTGIKVFFMPIETFIVAWLSFVYYLVAALIQIYLTVKKGDHYQ